MNGETDTLLQGLCLVFNIVVCFGIPLGGLLWAARKGLHPLKPFLLGVAAFVISQIYIRLPILQLVLPAQGWFIQLSGNSWAYGLFLGVTAGIFEECARLVFLSFAGKSHRKASDGILFGLGHGGIEAMLIVGISNIIAMYGIINQPVLYQGIGYGTLLCAGVERIFAMAFHVGATLIVLYGLQKGKRVLYTFIAIALHTILDAGSVILPAEYEIGMAGIEIYLAVVSILTLAAGIRLVCVRDKSKLLR